MLRRTLGGLATGLAVMAALVLPGSPSASAGPKTYPWNVDTYDFSYTATTYRFIFTNLTSGPLVDVPVPFTHPLVLHVAQDTCMQPVSPGLTCAVTVAYTPGKNQQPVSDVLQLKFTDLSGQPVATPSVRLFGAGAEYVTTDYIGNDVFLPGIVVGDESVLWLWFHLHGPNPVDLPPDLRAPWFVVGDTCGSVQPGATTCQLGIAFRPTAPGQFSTSFQMPFTDPLTKLPVDFPVVTLNGTAH